MIINFSVQNFGSIKDKQTLSFEADKDDHLENYYIVEPIPGLRLLKLSLIYGANASGKTTVLNALNFLGGIVNVPLKTKTEILDFHPFLFAGDTPKQNTIFSLEFVQNQIRYFYEVEFNKKAVVRELLKNYNPNSAVIFERTTNLEKQLTSIELGSKIKKAKTAKQNLEANTLWNNTVLGGFRKTNIDLGELKEVADWFMYYLNPVIYSNTELDNYVTTQIEESKINKEDVVGILKKADFNISGISIKKDDVDVPESFIEYLEKTGKRSPEEITELKTKGKITSMNLEVQHTVDGGEYILPFDSESQGTKRYYGFAGLMSLLIKESRVFPVDELETSLHPDLYTHFLLSFLANAKSSQLIATTHNREILNNKEIFRNDSIWFTDKDEHAATQLYSLSDFDSSVIRDTSNVYNAYKSGKLGAVPNLGDYYIDTNHENK